MACLTIMYTSYLLCDHSLGQHSSFFDIDVVTSYITSIFVKGILSFWLLRDFPTELRSWFGKCIEHKIKGGIWKSEMHRFEL